MIKSVGSVAPVQPLQMVVLSDGDLNVERITLSVCEANSRASSVGFGSLDDQCGAETDASGKITRFDDKILKLGTMEVKLASNPFSIPGVVKLNIKNPVAQKTITIIAEGSY